MTQPRPGKRALWLLSGVVGIAVVGWAMVSLYSPPNPYREALTPIHQFVEASLAGDSVRLAASGASAKAVAWGLETARGDVPLLRALAEGLSVGHGMREGDTTVLLLRGSQFRGCGRWPLTVIFTGPAARPQIQELRADCRPTGSQG